MKQQLHKYSKISKIVLLLFLVNNVVFTQPHSTDSLSTFHFKWSNDFEYGTDFYYTNGFSFQLISPSANLSFVNSFFLPYSKDDFVLHGFTLLQDIFTPKAKFYIPDQLNGDRPFAAFILAGNKQISYNKTRKEKLYSEIQIGVLGPAALGEEVQNGIHSLLPTSAEVEGWENQISNSLMLNYTASFQKSFSIRNWFDVKGKATAKAGLPYTLLDGNVGIRLGVFDDLPSEFEFLSERILLFYISLNAGASIIGYNATLQGGLFSNSVYTLSQINRIVGNAEAGLTFVYKSLLLEYHQMFVSPEFHGALYHSWGYLKIEVKL